MISTVEGARRDPFSRKFSPAGCATPCQFFMRQAGRILPPFRSLLERHGFVELTRSPSLVSEITALPARFLPVDSLILFADILSPLMAHGLEFDFAPGGPYPRFDNGPTSLARLAEGLEDPIPIFPGLARVVSEASRAARLPVIGFVGGPITLAHFMFRGDRGSRTKQLCFSEDTREGMKTLLSRLVETLARAVREQIAAGCSPIYLFDTQAHDFGLPFFREWGMPGLSILLRECRSQGVPLVYYNGYFPHLVGEIELLGVDGLHFNPLTEIPFSENRVTLGNFPEDALIRPLEWWRERWSQIFSIVSPQKYIFSLGQGLTPEAPLERLRRVAEEYKEFRPQLNRVPETRAREVGDQ